MTLERRRKAALRLFRVHPSQMRILLNRLNEEDLPELLLLLDAVRLQEVLRRAAFKPRPLRNRRHLAPLPLIDTRYSQGRVMEAVRPARSEDDGRNTPPSWPSDLTFSHNKLWDHALELLKVVTSQGCPGENPKEWLARYSPKHTGAEIHNEDDYLVHAKAVCCALSETSCPHCK